MAITKSAKKEIKASERKRVFNLRRLRAMRQSIKAVKTTAHKGDAKMTMEQFRLSQKAIDKAAKRGVIKKNTASRKKSRLARALKEATQVV